MMQKEGDVDGKERRRTLERQERDASHHDCPQTNTSVETLKETIAQVRGPEETDFSRDGSADSSLGKRKMAEREPESPGQHNPLDLNPVTPYTNKKERTYYDEMEQDSPASYPKHVMVPADGPPEGHKRPEQKEMDPGMVGQTGPPLLTPDSLARRQNSFEGPPLREPYHHDMYRPPSYHDVDYSRQTFGEPEQTRPPEAETGSARPRRWACDYCNVATFLSYEEACAHEEVCARQHAADEDHRHRHMSAYGQPPHGHPHAPPHHQQGTGLGALYHASQEVVTPPTPHRSHPSVGGHRWGSRGPPLPVLPHEHGYYRQGYYDQREDPAYYGRHEQYYAPPPPQYSYGYPPHHAAPYGHQPPHSNPPPHGDRNQKRMLLAMPTDSDSLSDRQCYVRAEMCEIFAATDKDVSARHSKGAQKLVVGQVGIRCIHCAHLRPRDRAERAVCYPSSISRIYQTVADMQRFHFEQCTQIPKRVQDIYKSLKTTRPRGVGSPQAYWVQSAKSLGLVDTGNGIRFDTDLAKEQYQIKAKEPVSSSDMSVDANSKSTQS